MILIFFGCSCVGKTTIMEILNKNYDYAFLQGITTRPLRESDHNKERVSFIEFSNMNNNGEIIYPNFHFNNWYGISKKDYAASMHSTDSISMFDFDFKNINQIKKSDGDEIVKILLIPENEIFLINNIENSGRISRKNEIINEYREIYSNIRVEYDDKLDLHCFINNPKNQNFIIESIFCLVEKKKNKNYEL